MVSLGDRDVESVLEGRILPWAVLVATALSVADHIWHFLGEGWEQPLELFVLFVLLRWMEQTRRSVTEARRRMDTMVSGAPVRHYDNYADFYRELSRAMSGARSHVYVTYERLHPPASDIAEAANYFDSALDWAKKDPGKRSLQRLIRVPEGNDSLDSWAQQQLVLARAVRNYEVAIVRAPANAAEGRSFAVIDGRVVFVAFFMDRRTQLRSYSLQSARVAQDYEEYFRDVWGTALVSSC
jgi:hypothetical protein